MAAADPFFGFDENDTNLEINSDSEGDEEEIAALEKTCEVIPYVDFVGKFRL